MIETRERELELARAKAAMDKCVKEEPAERPDEAQQAEQDMEEEAAEEEESSESDAGRPLMPTQRKAEEKKRKMQNKGKMAKAKPKPPAKKARKSFAEPSEPVRPTVTGVAVKTEGSVASMSLESSKCVDKFRQSLALNSILGGSVRPGSLITQAGNRIKEWEAAPDARHAEQVVILRAIVESASAARDLAWAQPRIYPTYKKTHSLLSIPR